MVFIKITVKNMISVTQNYKETNTTYKTALSVLLLLLASEVYVPIGVVPITLQTFVVFLLGLNLDKCSAINTGLLFVTIKLMALPFWACPSFGYIIGIGFSISAMCYLRQLTHNNVINCLAGYLVTNSIGSVWLYCYLHNWMLVWQYGLEPFILIEVFKSVVAIYMSKYLTRRDNN